MEVTKLFKLKLTQPQIEKVEYILNGLRGVYNLYIEKIEEVYKVFGNFLSAYEFNGIMNHELRLKYPWIHELPAKARIGCLLTVEKAYKMFFKGKAKRPRFKSKRRNPIKSFCFVKNGIREVSDGVIWIPILHEVKICEKDYFNPYDEITSGRIVKKADGYYMSLWIKRKNPKVLKNVARTNPIGIDLGIRTYATISDGINHIKISNPNKRENVKRVESKIKRLQKVISNKIENNKKKGETAIEKYHSKNIDKVRYRINKLYLKLTRIREDFIKKLVYFLVARTKPEYICIEDIGITDMLKKSYRRLSKNIANCKWFYFREHLTFKCKQYDVELRIANKEFKSSQICSHCGHEKEKLKLTTRTYECKHCGLVIDRDINAAINLLKTTDYKIA